MTGAIARLIATVASVASVFALGACGDDGPSTPAAAGAGEATEAPAAVEIVALDNTFRPNRLVVVPGTEIRFVNRGRNDHDALSLEGTWGVAAVDFEPGSEYVHVFEEPGTYRYYCSLHGIVDFGMIGEIVVEQTGDPT